MSRPDRAVFRLPAAALFLPVLLLFCITPLATGGPWWGVLFAVPAVALVWVIVARTTATPVGVTAHGLLGSKRMAWSEMDGLEFRDSRWAIAVGLDGRRLRLPMVRPRDLPVLTSVSGGSLLLGDDAPAAPDGESATTSGDPADGEPDGTTGSGTSGIGIGIQHAVGPAAAHRSTEPAAERAAVEHLRPVNPASINPGSVTAVSVTAVSVTAVSVTAARSGGTEAPPGPPRH